MTIVQNLEEYAAAVEFIGMNDILAFDIETTGLNVRKDKIMGFGVSNATDGFYVPMRTFDGQGLQDANLPRHLLISMLSLLCSKRLLTWNASFDIAFTKNETAVDLLDALHADVLLMKHTCDEEFPFGLKEVATKIYGHDATNEKREMLESIKANGGTAKEYYKASTETLAKYCVQDCLLTFKLYNYYSKELQRQELEKFYYHDEVMPLYKHVTIPMEQAGVGLDVEALRKAGFELRQAIDGLEAQIQQELEPMLDVVFTRWFLNKDYPLQTPTGKQPVWAKKYASQYDAWAADNPASYMFNLQSKHHLKKLFFDTLGCEPLSRTPTGMPQVDEEFMDSVASTYPWVQKLVQYNKLNKLLSTYVLRFIEEAEDEKFYPSFMQHRTVSGRYGSDLQQLPRPVEGTDANDLVAQFTSRIREFIIALPGHRLISADYEQLEPSVFSHNSGDARLCAIFNSGVDFYSEVALRTEKLQGVSSDKSAPNYLGKVDKSRRQKAKSYALGIAYGMSAYKLKFEINCSEAEAERLVKDYYEAFPQLKTTMDSLQHDARTAGVVSSQAGRRRRMPSAAYLYRKHGPAIENALDLWKKYNEVPSVYAAAKADYKVYKNLMNNALNFPIQSLAASIVNRACIAIAKRLKAEGLQAYICMQIHDEIVCMASQADTARVCEIMQEVMQTIVTLSVPLRASPVVGNNFRECK